MKFKTTRNSAVDVALNEIIDMLGVFLESITIKDTVFNPFAGVEIEVYKDAIEVRYADSITLALYKDGTFNVYETNHLFRGMANTINESEVDNDSLKNNVITILSYFDFNKDF